MATKVNGSEKKIVLEKPDDAMKATEATKKKRNVEKLCRIETNIRSWRKTRISGMRTRKGASGKKAGRMLEFLLAKFSLSLSALKCFSAEALSSLFKLK